MSKKNKRQGRALVAEAAATAAVNAIVERVNALTAPVAPPPPQTAPPPAPPPPSAIETIRGLDPVSAALFALDPTNAAAIAREHAARGGR